MIMILLSLRNAIIIGEGAYGTVYVIEKKRFALKKIFLQSEEFVVIYRTEIESLQKFKHRNIINLIDYIECDENNSKVAFLLFPFMERGSLRNQLDKRLPNHVPNIKTILILFVEMCSAFKVLHNYSPSYVHQDIKPENVMIDGEGKTCFN